MSFFHRDKFLVDEMEISCYTAISEKDVKGPYQSFIAHDKIEVNP